MLLSNVSIKRPVFASMMNIFIIVIGLLAYKGIGIDNQPKVDLPIVRILVQVPGATPKYIEQNVLNPIESSLRVIEGVDTIDSTVTTGTVVVRVTFLLSEDINVAVNNIRNAMMSVTGRRTWPSTALTPAVKALDPNAAPIMDIALSSEKMSIGELSRYANETFSPNLQQVQGVGDVGIAGLRLPEYDIYFSNEKLQSLNLPALNVIAQIQGAIVSLPGGQVKNARTAYNINASTLPNSVDDLAVLPITLPGGQQVKLAEIARVVSTIQEETTYGEIDRKPALIVYVTKSPVANSVQVAAGLRKAVGDLSLNAKDKVSIKIVNDNTLFISQSIDAVTHDFLIGAFLTVLIVFLFLHDFKATLISSIAIPTSVLGTIAVIHFLGFTLNSMTTLALSLSIGIIVDDAIVVIENIHRHMEMKKGAMQATYDAMKEIGIPAIAITFAIVAVFLPVAFMDGIIGRFFYEFGVTVSVSVLISLFVAFTLTPTLGSRMLTLHGAHHKKNIVLQKIDVFLHALEQFYLRCVRWTLAHRYKTVGAGFLVLVLSVLLLRFVPSIFQPQVDNSSFSVAMQLNPNTALPQTRLRAQEVETLLKKYPGVTDVFFRMSDQSSVTFTVMLVPPTERAYTLQDIQKRVRKDIQVFKKSEEEKFSIGRAGRNQQPLQVILTDLNTDRLALYSEDLQAYIKTLPDVVDVMTDAPPQVQEIKVTPNMVMANALGVTSNSIAQTLSYLLYGVQVGSYSEGTDSFDIMARLNSAEALTPDSLTRILVSSSSGQPVALSDVAQITIEPQNSVIQHHNGMEEITILANYTGKDLGGTMKSIENHIKETAPLGLNSDFSGDAKRLQDANKAVIQALFLSLLFAYMVLCSQFESFLTPFVILLSVPLAFSGAFLGLLAFDQPLSLYAMVGLILLTGLVKKNAILLLDFAEQQIQSGHAVHAALEMAGKTRLRPILMTTLAMIFGMVPMAYSTSLGHELRSPMGVAVIGGLISSTILTLLVIPCVFSILSDLKLWCAQRLLSIRGED